MTNQDQALSGTQPFVQTGRLGFHYFPDTLHYTDRDLQQWLPVLLDLGAGWLVLRSDIDRAIPESFITSLRKAGINPLIQFPMLLERLTSIAEIGPLIDAYTRWGVTHIQFYDRPNLRKSWFTGGWTQQELVERFLDRFLPLAERVVKENAVPVMPALEPGGNYWDTAFLRAALQSMERRGEKEILDSLALSAYAWTTGAPAGQNTGLKPAPTLPQPIRKTSVDFVFTSGIRQLLKPCCSARALCSCCRQGCPIIRIESQWKNLQPENTPH